MSSIVQMILACGWLISAATHKTSSGRSKICELSLIPALKRANSIHWIISLTEGNKWFITAEDSEVLSEDGLDLDERFSCDGGGDHEPGIGTL